jgi:hypothetical protein
MITLAFLSGAYIVFIGSSLFKADPGIIRAQFGTDAEFLMNQISGVAILLLLSGVMAIGIRWMMGDEFSRWDRKTHLREMYTFRTAWRMSTGIVLLLPAGGIGTALWIGLPIVLRILTGW